jgi:hypothetical protein
MPSRLWQARLDQIDRFKENQIDPYNYGHR